MKFASLCFIVLFQIVINTAVFSQDNFYKTKQPRPLQQQQSVQFAPKAVQQASASHHRNNPNASSIFIKDLPFCSEAVKQRVAINKQVGKPLTDGIYKKYRISIASNKEIEIMKKLQESLKKTSGYVKAIVLSRSNIELVVLPEIQSESIKEALGDYLNSISFDTENYFVQ